MKDSRETLLNSILGITFLTVYNFERYVRYDYGAVEYTYLDVRARSLFSGMVINMPSSIVLAFNLYTTTNSSDYALYYLALV